MAFGDVMRKFLGKSEKGEQFSQMQTEDNLQHKVQERKKNSNEREHERFVEEARQEVIKQELVQFRKQRQEENMKTTIFDGPSILENKNPILKQKNIFNMKHAKQSKGMFFK